MLVAVIVFFLLRFVTDGSGEVLHWFKKAAD